MNKTYALTVLLLLAGCVGTPDTAQDSLEWYPRERDLAVQAGDYKAHSIALIDSSGLLLYRAYEGWGPSGDAFTNYAVSHDLADVPAWQGYLMAALAFEMAVTGADNDATLRHLAQGLRVSYDVTSVPGLLTRSVFADYTGARLPWMDTEEDRPTKFWTQGTGGRWYRNGVAKGHWNFSVVGCSIPLILERQGKLTLTAQTKQVLIDVLVPAVEHLHAGGWRIRDAAGGFTEFGDLRPNVTLGPTWPELPVANGFNRILVLNGLRSAGEYDIALLALYEELAPQWAQGIGMSMEAVGETMRAFGHWKLKKPSFSDMQTYAMATLCLLMQEDRRELTRHYHKGMVALWEFMRYERNAPFTLAYWLVRQGEAMARMADVEEDLRQYPRPQDKGGWDIQRDDTDTVQPLGNRPTNAQYYKSNPFRRVRWAPGQTVEPVRHSTTGARQLHAGMDYLLAYWLGRFLQVIPER